MPAPIKQASINKAIIGVALATSCVVLPGFAYASSPSGQAAGTQAGLNKKVEKRVAATERAVIKSPRDPALRAKLGQMYLAAGRFSSAGMTFEDAVSLGDKTPGTALGLVLAYTATGRYAEATVLLGQWGDTIPVSDHGLALALAGQPVEAVTLLGNAIRQGDNTPKMRQNLAYAYALAGHLPEARVIASQDIAVDQLDARVSEWALAASVGSSQSRVAALLGAPVRSDTARPAQLALAVTPAQPAVAQATLPTTPAADELPPLAGPAPAMAKVEDAGPAQAVAGPALAYAAAQPEPQPEVADIAEVMRRYEATKSSRAVIVPKQPSAVEAVRVRHDRNTATKPVLAVKSKPATGSHAVQLGSFSTEEGAHRAWNIFVGRDASLKGRELRITQAMVNGRRYFRVAAVGYEAAEARNKCSALKGRGSECLAYETKAPLHGSVPAKALAPKLARR